MLANLIKEPFDHPDWMFEVKWDGYRAVAEIRDGDVSLYSRNRISLHQKFSPIMDSLRKFRFEAILDGEIVVVKTVKNCRHYDRRRDAVKKVAQEIYVRIDNDLYQAVGDRSWQSDSPLYLIQSSVNPARVGHLKKKLFDELKVNPQGKAALEVGCGGGLLCEEIARMGFDVTGIDPSEHSLQIATRHAKASGLRINYEKGTGEALPYRDNSSDIVFCCDVLEHVRDVPKVISEISRVLKPGGFFGYDTLNRTFMSKLAAKPLFSKSGRSVENRVWSGRHRK